LHLAGAEFDAEVDKTMHQLGKKPSKTPSQYMIDILPPIARRLRRKHRPQIIHIRPLSIPMIGCRILNNFLEFGFNVGHANVVGWAGRSIPIS
jgi:hypothetical protein